MLLQNYRRTFSKLWWCIDYYVFSLHIITMHLKCHPTITCGNVYFTNTIHYWWYIIVRQVVSRRKEGKVKSREKYLDVW